MVHEDIGGPGSVIYRSHNLLRPESGEILRIVEVALRRNRAFDVSGILYFDDTLFVQYLEGPGDNIGIILEAMKRDSRHSIDWLHKMAGPDELRFPGVEMAFYDGRRVDRCEAATTLAKSTRDMPPDEVLTLLLALPYKRPQAAPSTSKPIVYLS